jgi:Fe-Mn family superoxide dismutase
MERRTFLKAAAATATGLVLNPLAGCSSGEAKPNPLSIAPGLDGFALPELAFAANALEPHIDQATMELHHGKHHAGYVKKLNDALEGSPLAGKNLEDVLAQVTDEQAGIRNNGGGHYNHTLFWKTLSTQPQTVKGTLAKAIEADFGSFGAFKESFAKAAATVFGSGWAWLSVGPDGKLFVSSTPNQDNPLMANLVEQPGKPILGLDVWEHAYYLHYQNRRKDYIDAFFNLIHWEQVGRNYDAARPA